MKPEFIAPFVGYLASEQIEDTGTVHEVFGGYAARLRWQRTYGCVSPLICVAHGVVQSLAH
jgi:multifunctional beta-oxidation protein